MEFPWLNSCLDARENTPVRDVSAGNFLSSSAGGSPVDLVGRGQRWRGGTAGPGSCGRWGRLGRLGKCGRWGSCRRWGRCGMCRRFGTCGRCGRCARSALQFPLWRSVQREGFEQLGSAAKGLHDLFVRSMLCTPLFQETQKLPRFLTTCSGDSDATFFQ